ncbi:unnamed protein product [Mesocestoides corti]|nr:unnamed protein product [Mesocestoides corti]
MKRKREELEDTEVLDERSVKRLHKLLKQSNEENDLVPKRKKIEPISLGEDESSDEEAEDVSVKPALYGDDGSEYNDEWEKFFKPNADGDGAYSNELLQNIDEAKSVVAEEMSDFCGSFAGDLDDLKAIDDIETLPEELKDHIRLLKDVMSHFRSGPLPKTIKMLPHLPGYESLLEMLSPLEWTNHVFPRVVKIFASKGNEQALCFYENYLLPKVRDDIAKNRRLSVQLFEALITSIFRPEEFVAGIFLPWIRSDMSKTEGIILSHLLKKASIRARFAAVALALTCEEEFSIPRSMIIEAILNKKYIMPEAAISHLIAYFTSFDKDCSAYFTDEGRMPLTWFRSLLTFLEFYRDGVCPGEREQLIRLCRRHEHPSITPEIRALIGLIPTEPKV